MLKDIHHLTPRPPMGWNSFDCYGQMASEKVLLDNVEVMAKRLKPYGYTYFVLDVGWYGEYDIEAGCQYPPHNVKHANKVRIDEYGRYLPSKCFFHNGLDDIISRTHKCGLKFGIHIMRGIPRKAVKLNLPILGTKYTARDIADVDSVCSWCQHNYGINMNNPGAQQYYNSVIDLLASWGVDFIKVDDIVSDAYEPNKAKEIEAVVDAVQQCDRDIVISLSPGDNVDPALMDVYNKSNMLRITSDIWDNREDIDKAFDKWYEFSQFGGNGFWTDLDMIPFGHLQLHKPRYGEMCDNELFSGKGFERMSGLTNDQKYTFITMRALAASPLFMGGDLPTSDEFSYQLITNTNMIDCNQNGIVGQRVYQQHGIEVWHTSKKDNNSNGWIGIFNRNTCLKQVSLKPCDLGLEEYQVYTLYDIWNEKEVEITQNSIREEINPDGVLFLKYQYNN